jgi:hypothetical protein
LREVNQAGVARGTSGVGHSRSESYLLSQTLAVTCDLFAPGGRRQAVLSRSAGVAGQVNRKSGSGYDLPPQTPERGVPLVKTR